MPIFEIQGPDGRLYEADAPDQASAVAAYEEMQRRGPSGAQAPGQASGNNGDVRLHGPDGSSFSFPAGTPRATIENAMRSHYGQSAQAADGYTIEQQRALALAAARRRRSEAETAGSASSLPGIPVDEPSAPSYGGTGMNTTAGANEALYGILGAPVDMMRGAMNLGIRGVNAATGADVGMISEDSFGGSRSIAQGMGAMAPQLDPRNTVATSTGDRIARGVGQGVAGTVLPAGMVAGAARAGVLGPQAAQMGTSVFGHAGSMRDAALGAAGGAGAAIGQEMAPKGYGPLGSLAGGIAGSTAAMGGMAAASSARNVMAPFTAGGREMLAGRRLDQGASDPQAFRRALDNPPAPLVPGSRPTTFQQTGDLGIGAMERGAAVRAPDQFAQRRADQNSARTSALGGIETGGAPEKVAASVRQRLDEIEAESERLIEAATAEARGRTSAPGAPMAPEVAGGNMRGALETARAQAKEREHALWSAVDPDGTMTLGLGNTRKSAQDLAEEMSPLAQPMSDAERQIYGAIGQAGETVRFRAMRDLQQNLKSAMRAERMANGESPVYRRMSIVSAGIAKDFDDAVAGKVAQEAQAVARGEMRADNTVEARWAREIEAWREGRQAAAGNDGGTSFGGYAGGRTVGVSRPYGAEGQASRQPGGPSGNSGVPGDAGGAQGRPVSLTELRSLGPDDPYFVKSRDGQTFVPRVLGDGQRTADLGTAPDIEAPGRDLPIRIRRSDMVRHVGNDVHQNDARALGYRDTWAMVQDISASWSQMRKGRYGRVQLVKPARDGNGVAVVELAPSDDTTYWRVVSAHRNRDDQLGETLLAREHTPSSPSGNDASLVKRSPQGRQEAEFARDRIRSVYTPMPGMGQGSASFDRAAMDRLGAANAATRDRVGTFDNRTLGPIRQRPSTAAPYTMPAGVVPAQVFNSSPRSFEAIGQLRAAVGQEAATDAIQGYAVGEVLRVAGRPDGTLDATRLAAWRRSHANALRAVPELDAKLADAGRASQAIAEVAAARKAASEAAKKGALGRLVGVDAPEDVVRIVGGVFSAQDAAQRMRSIRQAIGGDAEAAQGLRRAVVEHMAGKFVGNTEAGTSGIGTMKSDGFQTFVRSNAPALEAAGFSPDELRTLGAIAEDLQRANRSIASVKNPGGSDTAQNLYRIGKDGSPFGAAARSLLAPGGIGLGVGITSGSATGLAAGAAVAAFAAMRNAGLRTVNDLITDALLNPERARLLLSKVKSGEEGSRWQALAKSYGQSAIRALSQDGGRVEDDRRTERTPSREERIYSALTQGMAVPDRGPSTKNSAIAAALGLTGGAPTPKMAAVAAALFGRA